VQKQILRNVGLHPGVRRNCAKLLDKTWIGKGGGYCAHLVDGPAVRAGGVSVPPGVNNSGSYSGNRSSADSGSSSGSGSPSGVNSDSRVTNSKLARMLQSGGSFQNGSGTQSGSNTPSLPAYNNNFSRNSATGSTMGNRADMNMNRLNPSRSPMASTDSFENSDLYSCLWKYKDVPASSAECLETLNRIGRKKARSKATISMFYDGVMILIL
jgi:hypothetical protein